jgi:hypothetical protein
MLLVSWDTIRDRTAFHSTPPSAMPLLRDSPLLNNVASSLLMVMTYRLVTEVAGWLRVRFSMAAQSRQVLQMSLSAAVVFWPLFDTSEWSWRLNAILPSAMLVRVMYKVCLVATLRWVKAHFYSSIFRNHILFCT